MQPRDRRAHIIVGPSVAICCAFKPPLRAPDRLDCVDVSSYLTRLLALGLPDILPQPQPQLHVTALTARVRASESLHANACTRPRCVPRTGLN